MKLKANYFKSKKKILFYNIDILSYINKSFDDSSVSNIINCGTVKYGNDWAPPTQVCPPVRVRLLVCHSGYFILLSDTFVFFVRLYFYRLDSLILGIGRVLSCTV